jgi:hypothetical protein
MDAEEELVQLTEAALADAEEALRLDPSETNRRRVMKAWFAVRGARERARRCAQPEQLPLPGSPPSRGESGVSP